MRYFIAIEEDVYFAVKTYLASLQFHVFTPNAENVLEKELKKEIPVSVGIELVSGDMSENA